MFHDLCLLCVCTVKPTITNKQTTLTIVLMQHSFKKFFEFEIVMAFHNWQIFFSHFFFLKQEILF